MSTLKCVILGDHRVGKTAFIKRHQTGQFEIAPVHDEKPIQLPFQTSHGEVTLEMYEDGAGPICPTPDCIILMFDLTRRDTLDVLPGIYELYKFAYNLSPAIPTVVCGNKCDLQARAIGASEIQKSVIESGLTYYDISSKSNYNYEKPFLYLTRQCLAPTLRFTAASL